MLSHAAAAAACSNSYEGQLVLMPPSAVTTNQMHLIRLFRLIEVRHQTDGCGPIWRTVGKTRILSNRHIAIIMAVFYMIIVF